LLLYLKKGNGEHRRSMTAKPLYRAFADLSTPLIAHAALRLETSFRISPPGIRPIRPNQRLASPALPVRHSGSVDVFLEAIQGAAARSKNKIPQSGKAEQD
jgi:4-hydroxy-4-methyl-2-oxoglutarate aldolase